MTRLILESEREREKRDNKNQTTTFADDSVLSNIFHGLSDRTVENQKADEPFAVVCSLQRNHYRLDHESLSTVNQPSRPVYKTKGNNTSGVTLLIAWTRPRQIYHSKSSNSKKFRLNAGWLVIFPSIGSENRSPQGGYPYPPGFAVINGR